MIDRINNGTTTRISFYIDDYFLECFLEPNIAYETAYKMCDMVVD